MIHGLLGKFLAPKAAEMLTPVVKFGGIALAAFALFQCGVSEGKEAAALKLERKLNDDLIAAQNAFLERDRAARESYETTLQLVAQARSDAPQIIREIRDAPQTTCSGEPVGPRRIELLNAAITGAGAADSGTGSPADGATAAPTPLAG